MAGERQIIVDLVMDSDDFEKKSRSVGDSAEKMGRKVEQSSSGAEKLGRSWDDVGESFDNSESKFTGTADLLDGLATTMGLPISGAIEMTRGFADMASGIANSLAPALAGLTNKFRGLTGSMKGAESGLVGGGGRAGGGAAGAVVGGAAGGLAGAAGMGAAAIGGLVVAAAGAGAEIGYLGKKATEGQSPLASLGNQAGWLKDKLLGIVGMGAAAAQSLEELSKAGKEINGPDALSPKGGGVSVDDLANYSGNGKADWSSKGAADRIRKAGEEAQKAASDALAKSAESAAKAAGNAADKAAKAVEDKLKKRFDKVETVLEAALRSWQDKLRDAKSMRDGFRDLFALDIKNDDPFGLVHGIATQADNIKKWVATIAKLRKMGFREGIIRDLVDRGPSSLADAVELSHVSKKDVNALYDSTQSLGKSFSNDETERRTGVDVAHPKPVKVTLNVSGSDKDLVNMIKKWVRTEGGGNVQVAFGKK
jgi:hypothetical protein